MISHLQTTHNLKLHKRIYTGEKPFICLTCHKSFSRTRSLKVHMRIHTEEKPYASLYAQYVITHLCKLEVYGDILYQTGKKPFSCLVCYKSFPRIDCLTKHLRFHSNEKPSSKAYNQAKHLSHVTNLVQNNTGEEGWKNYLFLL